MIGNYHFARDYGCVHPGMPLGRKHLRRSRDAPTSGMGLQRTASILRRKCREVKCPWGSLHHSCRVSRTLLCYGPARGYGQGFGAPLTGIVGDGRGDTSVSASIERSRRNKALAKRNRNRGRRRALTTAGDQYRCHCYVDNSFDKSMGYPIGKGS